MENNVGRSLFIKFSPVRRLFVVILLLSVCQKFEAVDEECDFVPCASHVRKALVDLRSHRTPFICENVLGNPYCSEQCMYKYFPTIFTKLNGNLKNFTKYCIRNISRSDANWSCISRHSFQLLTCFANVSSLTTNSIRAGMPNAESCRKSYEFKNCPKTILSDCGEKSVEMVTDLLQHIEETYMSSPCEGINLKKVLNMPANYQLEYDYNETAKYIDIYFSVINGCFTRLIDYDDLERFLCGDYDPLSECTSFELTKRSGKSFPPEPLRKLYLKMFSMGDFRCTDNRYVTLLQLSSTEITPSKDQETDLKSHTLNEETEKIKSSKDQGTDLKSHTLDEETEKVNSSKYHETDLKSHTLNEETEKIKSSKDHETDFDNQALNDKTEMFVNNVTGKSTTGETVEEIIIQHSSVVILDIKHLKASSALSLQCDITLFILLLLFIFS